MLFDGIVHHLLIGLMDSIQTTIFEIKILEYENTLFE